MGLIKVLNKIKDGTLKGLEVADGVLSHPAVEPFTMLVPYGWARAALKSVRHVNGIAKAIKDETGEDMPEESKRSAFAGEFRKEFPEASAGDINALAALMVKVDKGAIEEEK